jgi:hypothetical protein
VSGLTLAMLRAITTLFHVNHLDHHLDHPHDWADVVRRTEPENKKCPARWNYGTATEEGGRARFHRPFAGSDLERCD